MPVKTYEELVKENAIYQQEIYDLRGRLLKALDILNQNTEINHKSNEKMEEITQNLERIEAELKILRTNTKRHEEEVSGFRTGDSWP